MVLNVMLRRLGWYVSLVVLTGAVVIGARGRPNAAPDGDAAPKGRARHSEAPRRP